MEREGAGGVGDLVGKAEARAVHGANQVVRSLSTGFKSSATSWSSEDTSEEVS